MHSSSYYPVTLTIFLLPLLQLLQAAHRAVDDYVHSNMVVGLGTGSTAWYAGESSLLPLAHHSTPSCNHSLSLILSLTLSLPFIPPLHSSSSHLPI